MRYSCGLLILALSFTSTSPRTQAQQLPLSEVANRAEAESKLTATGSTPFHLKAKIAEKDNPDSDFKADVEVFWMAQDRWRQEIRSPDFSQTLIVSGGQDSEQDTGDYYPFWLRELVTAMLDPLPMLAALDKTNVQIAKPTGSEESTSCARFQSKAGVPPVENTLFYVFCFEGSHGLPAYVVTPEYSIVFKDYKGFGKKQVARLLVTDPEPGTTIEAKITDLSPLSNIGESLFSVSQPTPKDRHVKSLVLSESVLRSLALENSPIVWPTVRSGKTDGVLSIYVCVDRSGHVRETFPLNSDNAGLDDAVRQQVEKWLFRPAISNGAPVQVEGILTFVFNTTVENPIPILSDAEARKLATKIVEPIVPAGIASPGTSFTVRVSVGTDGKMAGIENPNNVPTTLFLAAYAALKQWRFQPYLRDGKADYYKADITFQVP
jgi:Gram-negative bacterial TonB protein C-terminal